MSVLSLYLHSALLPVSHIKLQCIFVETLLAGRVCFRVDHVSPALICELAPNCAAHCLDFRPLQNSHLAGGERLKTLCLLEHHLCGRYLDHEYQPLPASLRASDAVVFCCIGVYSAALRRGECFAPSHFPDEPSERERE